MLKQLILLRIFSIWTINFVLTFFTHFQDSQCKASSAENIKLNTCWDVKTEKRKIRLKKRINVEWSQHRNILTFYRIHPSRQTDLLYKLENTLHWTFTHLFCVSYQCSRELQEEKKRTKKKNESINKPLSSSSEEGHSLVCYLGSLTFTLYFANTKNYNLCDKGECI